MKKYKIGYIAGVFDLFHLGHLNLLRNVKAECEFLIVGVLVDELVLKYKKKTPFIPFIERMDIVNSIKFVDQTVAVDDKNINKIKAWELYHFDCLFSGDDWKNEKSWLEDRNRLNELGADIFFFPYTQSTSSTQIKKLISEDVISKDRIIIFGAGNRGRKALDFYGHNKVACFADNDSAKTGNKIEGYPIISFDLMVQLKDEYKIVISVKQYEDIVEQMLKNGIHEFEIFNAATIA